MRKDIIIYAVITLVIVLLIAYFASIKSPVKINPPSSSNIIKPVPITNTINITNQTTNTITTNKTNKTTSKTSFCVESSNETEPILNGNFSTGTYYGWNTTGTGFGTAPLYIPTLNKEQDYYGEPWNNYGNNTYMATTFEKGIAIAPGNLTSDPFVVTEPFLNFKMIGPQSGEIYVEILRNNTPVELAFFDTYNATPFRWGQSSFENESIPLTPFMCQKVQIRVVFNLAGTSETDYVAVTGFYLSKEPIMTKGTLVGYKIENLT